MRKLTNQELRVTAEQRIKNKSQNSKVIYLILDNLRSVHNIGAIFRIADAVGVKKLYLCGICAHPPRIDLEKTACKTIPYVEWEYCENTIRLVKQLKSTNIKIIALEQTDESLDYKSLKYSGPMALVVGNEVDGVDQKVLDLCDQAIDIPMLGFANSLNVTTALGIVLYSIN